MKSVAFRAGILACVVASAVARGAIADEWPQWLGPNRDSVWNETGILDAFPDGGPKVLWRAEVAGGYAGPAVADGCVYVTDYVRAAGDATNDSNARSEVAGLERILCFDAATGEQRWKYEYPCLYKISYAAGPRATPTVADGKVYVLGAEGNLLCLDAALGQVVWSKDLNSEYSIETPLWGFCGHPLVDGQRLICLVGGQGSVAVAFDKDTGKELWRSLSASEPGYCAPSMITAGGARQLLIWHPEAINGLNPETGAVYWSEALAPMYGMSIAVPRKAGDLLFASGIGSVGAVFRLASDKPSAEAVWRGRMSDGVYCSNAPPMIEGGVIYGTDCHQGCLRAVHLDNGERLWETYQPTTGRRPAKHGTAFIVKNGDRFFLFGEQGDLMIVRLSASGYEELSRAHVIEPTCEAFGRAVVWTHPAFANRAAYVRNDKELICVSLAKE